MNPEWRQSLDQAWLCLESWDVAGARRAAETACALAAGWGDTAGVVAAELLLARAALLISADQAAGATPPRDGQHSAGSGPTDAAHAAHLRLDAERAAALESPPAAPAIAPLGPDSSVDLIAAAAITATARLGDLARRPAGIVGASAITARSDAGGWQQLVEAADLEARGGSGMPIVEQALAAGEREGRRAVVWTALALRAALCARRGARGEERETQQRMRRLVEGWAVTLPTADAAAALARPDRARLWTGAAEARAASFPAAARLIDVAMALEQERDVGKLVDLALDAALEVAGAERGILLLLDPHAGYKVAATRALDAGLSGENLLALSSTVARLAVQSGEVVSSNDVRGDPRLNDRASVAINITSLLCAPIHAGGQRQGAIYLDRRAGGRPFDAGAIAGVRALGGVLASALLNARVIADLEVRTRELEAARDELSAALARRTVERDDVSRQLADLRDEVPGGAGALIGRAPAMQRLGRIIRSVAASHAPVLISGETGSGKELVARAIHAASARRDRPFVAVNCAALSENLLAAELFGAERGAYTGASTARPGLFVAADGGTLFLDEVGDMPPAMQATLLRVLETSEVRPVGAVKARTVDVRLLAASHRDLLDLVRRGQFRDDLRYRLEVVHLEVPPLRDRLEDLPELCEHLLRDVRRRYGLPERRLSLQALHALSLRRWPGNVRELRHVLAGAALAAADWTIAPEDLPPERAVQGDPLEADEGEAGAIDGHAVRMSSVRNALRATAGHRGKAARLLGISRSTLYRYLQDSGGAEEDAGANDGQPPPKR